MCRGFCMAEGIIPESCLKIFQKFKKKIIPDSLDWKIILLYETPDGLTISMLRNNVPLLFKDTPGGESQILQKVRVDIGVFVISILTDDLAVFEKIDVDQPIRRINRPVLINA